MMKRGLVGAVVAVLLTVVASGAAETPTEKRLRQLEETLRKTQEELRELHRQLDQQKAIGQATQKQAEQATETATTAAEATKKTAGPDTLRAYFKNGLFLETADGNFKLQAGALTQADWNLSYPSHPVQQAFKLTGDSNGVEFRRARLYLAGLVYGNIDFKFEYDFAETSGGQPAFKDVYIGMSKLPLVQYVRVGHFKEPFSLEEITPDTYTTFQERSLMNAFDQPDRNTGIGFMPTFFDQRMTFATGGFRVTDNFGNSSSTSSPYDVAARLTGLPIYEAGKNLVHLGFSYSHKFRRDPKDTIGFSSRPEAHLFPVNLVNTAALNTSGADLFNPEMALAWGPFSLQGEYTWALVDQVIPSNLTFEGGYVEASYFLTGENRASFYNLRIGAFDRVIPLNNFSIDGKNWGAWQVAARVSHLDLTSAAVHGGALDDVTAGVNWYLNPITKVTVNYVRAHVETVGDSNVLEGRFQLAF